jgi:integrase
MPKIPNQFTDLGIERLKTTGKRYHRTEGNGLYLIINAAGKKTWASYYPSADGKMKWHNIGVYPDCSLAKAREENRRVQEAAKDRLDSQNIQADNLSIVSTLRQVYELFITKGTIRKGKRKGEKLRDKTILGYKQIFEKDILPYLGDRKIYDIKKKHIFPVLEKIEERGAANQANQAFRRLHSIFDFAAARDLVDINPMASMPQIGKTNARDRVLSSEEIRIFWQWAEAPKEIHNILKLVLLTGARPGEVVGLNKQEVSGEWWSIPQLRSKTSKENRVFLTESAKTLLPEDGFSILLTNSVDQYLRRAINTGKLATAPFRPHDLRRTHATGLSDLGYIDEVIDALQGRLKAGVIGVYNKNAYDRERRAAALAWEGRLLAIMATLTASATTAPLGAIIRYTVELMNAVTGSDLMVTLSNGDTITIPVGEKSGFIDHAVKVKDNLNPTIEKVERIVTGIIDNVLPLAQKAK